MTTVYKLTDENAQTFNATQWGENVTHTASGEGDLCGPGWLHAYSDPLLAVLLNPIHANFEHPRLWECEATVGKDDHGLKLGCTSLTTLREIPLPQVTNEQRVRFGILCALAVKRPWKGRARWRRWAEAWLQGDRDSNAAVYYAYADAAFAAFAADAACAAYESLRDRCRRAAAELGGA